MSTTWTHDNLQKMYFNKKIKKYNTIITRSSLFVRKLLDVWSFASNVFKIRKTANFTKSTDCEFIWRRSVFLLKTYDLCRGGELAETGMELPRLCCNACDYNVTLVEDSNCTIWSAEPVEISFLRMVKRGLMKMSDMLFCDHLPAGDSLIYDRMNVNVVKFE